MTLLGSLKAKLIQISLGLLCILIVLALNIVDIPVAKMPINLVNFTLYDLITSFNTRPYNEVVKVFIVDIDDYSIAKEGRWPWSRDKIATIISTLQDAGVVTVGVDIIMSNPEINYAIGLKDKLSTIGHRSMYPKTWSSSSLQKILEQLAPEVDNDQILVNALKNYDVTLGFLFHDLLNVQSGLLPAPITNSNNQLLRPTEFNAHYFRGYNASLDIFINAAGHGGFVSNIPDLDDVVRQGLLLGSIDNKVYASLSLMTTMRFLLADHVDIKTRKTILGEKLYGLDVAGTFIPTTENAEILIPFWRYPDTLTYIPATNILHGNFDANDLAGSVVILGSSALMLGDYHPSPVSRSFPGVEMVGNMVAGMMGQQLIAPFDWLTFEGAFLFLLYGVAASLLLSYLGTALLILSTLLLCATLISLDLYFYSFRNTYIPMGSLCVLTLLQGMVNYFYGFILEKRQKHMIKQLFSQYVPETYVKELIASNATSSMEGETKELSVLFSDIRNFTAISEGLDVVDVKRLLNAFFTPVTEIIFNHQGTIDKYVGDMVIAFWGAPIPIENDGHARQAILTALKIFEDLPIINEQLINNGLPSVALGIGIGTGLMNVGDMGSKFRRAYTVLGDNVNIASRLEGLTKYYGVRILVTDQTRENQHEFLWRAVDRVSVKGRKSALTIYEPLGLLSEAQASRIEEINSYHLGLDLYFAQDWSNAAALFQKLQQQCADNYLYQLYSERIEQYKKNPPSKDWDGVFVHTEK